jgi:DNA polymerase-3 subunit epsilon
MATVRLFELLLSKDHDSVIAQSKWSDHKSVRLPAQIPHELIQKLPESAGIYYFHNIDGSVIYIGKSKNIRKRVITHFTRAATAKAARMSQATYDITFEETGNELTALLLESSEIKNYQPLFNRTGKRKSLNYGIMRHTDAQGFIHLVPGKINDDHEVVIPANNLEEARNMLMRKFSNSTCARNTADMT